MLLSVILFADYSDPDVIRVGDDYYLVSSSFQAVPGLPILHSRDLVNWTIVGHAVDRLPSPDFDRPQHGNGMWAPSLRHHDGWFWIYVGDPDRGIYMTRARDARGPWEPLTLVKEAKGWIDPCPLWDDDGSMYLVHAWAKSRAGFNGVLHVNRLSPDGRRVVDDGVMVFDGRERHPTIEGPKFYKRNGWYYIFAPAGGVKRGWQTVLRSKHVYGPYEDKIVLEGGLHQGALVDEWFVHFQDRGAYGRIVHRQPVRWINDWPEMDRSAAFQAAGPPPSRRPEGGRQDAGGAAAWKAALQTSDDFNLSRFGLQWQWHGNPQKNWYSLRNGKLRLSPADKNLWNATNLLLQKFSAPAFHATTLVDASVLKEGERAGLVVMGADYSALIVERNTIKRVTARNADQGGVETELGSVAIRGPVQLRVTVSPEAVARFSYSTGGAFQPLGTAFVARPGRWIGAKVGLFGRADFDWFRVEPFEPAENASLVVAQDGSGDFRTIQEAIDAIPQSNEDNQTVLIRNGTYREKVRIAKSYVALVGEDREKTRIEFAELRRNWRASHPDDYGAAVINIADGATDIVIANLTVLNDYGRKHGDHDHQFAIRAMDQSNRIAVLHANVIADGGDTFSPWNSESGLSYATDSYFEGHVDFVCPRGWSYITNSRFFGHNSSASIWHDGSRDPDQKFVIRHSKFDGVPNFPLGRNHRDAQFYLVDVSFSSNMADRAIYPANAPDPRQWGERYYYANARRDAGDFAWYADNLHTAEGSPRDEDVTAEWTFGGRWDPASLPAVLPHASIPRPENGWKWVDPAGVTLRWTPARNAREQRVYFSGAPASSPAGPRASRACAPGDGGEDAAGPAGETTAFQTGPLEPGKTYSWRVDDGPTWSFRVDPRTTRIALVGDSTVTEKQGWGRGFKSNVKDSAAVMNLARGGRSSKSYRSEGHWDDVLRRKPTHVLLQFGHNDEPGKGLERETDLPAFRANMARYIDDARAIGAKPILVTSLARRTTDPHLGSYANATREVAQEKNVQLIDLHAKSTALLDELTQATRAALGPDKTHLNEQGSALFGAMVAEELASELVRKPTANRQPPTANWSARMADSVMKRTPDPLWLDAREAPRWEYTPGLVLKAMFEVWQRTGDDRYWKYAHAYYDAFVNADGSIRAYNKDEYNIDRINPGKPLFLLYEKTKEEKYRKAIELLRQQMREHPRTKEGGFWHKKRYPYQMWLDGLYMGAPFLAQYGKTFNEPALFDEVINQFVWMESHARDEKSGLLYHGWDESRQQKWSDPQTGRSPALWGRAMGWYAMGLVDTLDFIPLEHPRRKELIGILQRLSKAITKVQDPKSGVWWQVVDQPGREGNYREASVSVMFSYALLKGSRFGYIDKKYGDVGRRAYRGVLKEFIEVDKDGVVNIHHVCEVAGLGGDPEKGERYRSGTYEYYVTEKIRSNDPKAVGPFIFASLEMER
ncbi:MAG TPA: pectinesterase family protein [Thermoanaerobaculia bacterium]|nr:pectinesterase family protein [Thermoanaerobaculia bacterium]